MVQLYSEPYELCLAQSIVTFIYTADEACGVNYFNEASWNSESLTTRQAHVAAAHLSIPPLVITSELVQPAVELC